MKHLGTFLPVMVCAIFAISSGWAQSQGEREDPEIEQAVRKHLPAIETGSGEERKKAVHNLRENLMRRGWHKASPKSASRKQLSRSLLAAFRKMDESKENQGPKGEIVEVLVRYGDNESAKNSILRILDEGPEYLRQRVLASFSARTGLSGDDLFAKVDELHKKGSINLFQKLASQRSLDEARALPEVQRIVREAKDKRTFKQAAEILQFYGNPEAMREILPRLKELGLDQKYDSHGNGLFWINSRLLARYMESVEGNDLLRALEFLEMERGPQVYCLPVIVKRKLIQHPDVRIRRLAARQVRDGISGWTVDFDEAVRIVGAQLAAEKDSEIRGILQDAKGRIESSRAARTRLEKQRQEKIRERDSKTP